MQASGSSTEFGDVAVCDSWPHESPSQGIAARKGAAAGGPPAAAAFLLFSCVGSTVSQTVLVPVHTRNRRFIFLNKHSIL